MSRRYLVRLKPESLVPLLVAPPNLPLSIELKYFTHADGRPNPLLPYVILEIEDLVALDGKVLPDV